MDRAANFVNLSTAVVQELLTSTGGCWCPNKARHQPQVPLQRPRVSAGSSQLLPPQRIALFPKGTSCLPREIVPMPHAPLPRGVDAGSRPAVASAQLPGCCWSPTPTGLTLWCPRAPRASSWVSSWGHFLPKSTTSPVLTSSFPSLGNLFLQESLSQNLLLRNTTQDAPTAPHQMGLQVAWDFLRWIQWTSNEQITPHVFELLQNIQKGKETTHLRSLCVTPDTSEPTSNKAQGNYQQIWQININANV